MSLFWKRTREEYLEAGAEESGVGSTIFRSRLHTEVQKLWLLLAQNNLHRSEVDRMIIEERFSRIAVNARGFIVLSIIQCVLVWFLLSGLMSRGIIVSLCGLRNQTSQIAEHSLHPAWKAFRFESMLNFRVHIRSKNSVNPSFPSTRKHHLPHSRHDRHISELQLPQSY